VLVHHADAGRHRVPGSVEFDRHVVDQDLTGVGVVEPVQDIHQGALAGTVLAEQSVDLTRLDHQVDRIVRDQGPEPLRDPAQLQFHLHRLLRRIVIPPNTSPTA